MELVDGRQIKRPSNRGLFSPDREAWNQIHEGRFVKWQLGSSIQEIANEETVSYNAVKRSIQICEARLPRLQVVEARSTRLRLITFDRLHEQYTNVMEDLMKDPNPIVRLKALDCFRKTMSTDGAGVQVNNTQVNVVPSRNAEEVFDFETTIARLRKNQMAAHGPDRKAVVDLTPQAVSGEENDAEPSDHGA
jgi:predicted DNA-binding protein YlxM (UPF0122 family)